MIRARRLVEHCRLNSRTHQRAGVQLGDSFMLTSSPSCVKFAQCARVGDGVPPRRAQRCSDDGQSCASMCIPVLMTPVPDFPPFQVAIAPGRRVEVRGSARGVPVTWHAFQQLQQHLCLARAGLISLHAGTPPPPCTRLSKSAKHATQQRRVCALAKEGYVLDPHSSPA
jgi:hypothetical protein